MVFNNPLITMETHLYAPYETPTVLPSFATEWATKQPPRPSREPLLSARVELLFALRVCAFHSAHTREKGSPFQEFHVIFLLSFYLSHLTLHHYVRVRSGGERVERERGQNVFCH